MAKKSYYGQHIGNAFPLWSDARTSEQSLIRQFVNPIGNSLDTLFEQLFKVAENYTLPTAVVSDIDVYYYMRVPNTFTFQKLDSDVSEWLYTPPTVSGLIGSTYHPVTLATNNDIESFWYNAVPSRMSLETIASGACLIASGVMINSTVPLIVTSGIVDVPNQLYVTISGGNAYFNGDDYNYTTFTSVQIDGETRAGARVTEQLNFVQPDTQRTLHEYQTVTGIRPYPSLYNTTATIRIDSASFDLPDKPVAYPFLAVNEYKENLLFFWDIGAGPLGRTTLNLRTYNSIDPLLRAGGFNDMSDFMQFALNDINGNPIYALDVAVEPHSNRLWVVSSDTLYLFDADLHQPDTSGMSDRTYNAASVMELSSYWMLPGETVYIDYIWKRPVSDILKYRIFGQSPSGSTDLLVDNDWVPYVNEASSWNPAPIMRDRRIQSTDSIYTEEVGDWQMTLEVVYLDGTYSIDKKIFSVLAKNAIAQYNIAAVTGSPYHINAVDIDSEYKLWVRDVRGYKFQLEPHYDNMIIDFSRNVIYMREPYDQVRIFDYT